MLQIILTLALFVILIIPLELICIILPLSSIPLRIPVFDPC